MLDILNTAYTSEKVLDFLLSFVPINVGLVNKFTKFEQSIEKVICDFISGFQISHYSHQYTPPPVSSHFTFPCMAILNKMNEKQRLVFTGNILIS